jgi:multiple sugar transport system permease protein
MVRGRVGPIALLATVGTLLLAVLWLTPLIETVRRTRWVFTPEYLAFLSGNDPAAALVRRWFLNSAGTAVTITLITLLLSLPCAYAASRLEFPGKRALTWALLAGIMIPKEVLIVPHFVLMDAFRWLDSYPGIVAPQVVFPLVIVVLQRFFDGVPNEYREAAKLDGASELRILTAIYLPLGFRVTAALAAFVFITAWNNFLWPFLVTFDEIYFTVPVAIPEGGLQAVGAGLSLLLFGGLGLAALAFASRSGLIDLSPEAT